MATHKVLLDKRRQLKDGTYPLIIRIWSGSRRRDINLKTPLKESEFDETTQKVTTKHPNRKLINQKIQQALLEVQQTTLKLEIGQEVITPEKIKNLIVKPQIKLDFTAFGWQVVVELRQGGKFGNALFYESAIVALKNYTGKQTIQFPDVTYQFLKKLENSMIVGGLTVNGVAMYMRTIRAIYNRAIKEKLIDRANYPFDSYRIKMEATAKRNISKADIQAMVALEIEKETAMWHSRNYFLLCFNLIGISFADLFTLRPSDIVNGRISYRRKKTHKLYNIRLTDTAKELIEYYCSPYRTYILPVIPENMVGDPVKERKQISYGIKNTNKYLKRIATAVGLQQKLSTYWCRNSWANCAKRMAYSNEMIAEAMGHEYGNKVTAIYLDRFEQNVIDDMVEAVCKF
jgi:integrase/recombinase XerD